MNKSVRDALRIVYKLATTLVIVVPVVVFALPAEVAALPLAAGSVVAVGVISKVINELENKGIIPAWLTEAGGTNDSVDSNVLG